MDSQENGFRLKDCYNVLGEKWNYTFYPENDDNYSDFETLEFNESLIFSLHLYDPCELKISFRKPTELSILFGPINCFHFEKDKEPQLIIESFVGERVNFLEVKANGTIYLYHHFKKDSYRLELNHLKT